VYVTYKRKKTLFSTADVYVKSTLHDIVNVENYSFDPPRKTVERKFGKRQVEEYTQEKDL
jgi:hypothetical protein